MFIVANNASLRPPATMIPQAQPRPRMTLASADTSQLPAYPAKPIRSRLYGTKAWLNHPTPEGTHLQDSWRRLYSPVSTLGGFQATSLRAFQRATGWQHGVCGGQIERRRHYERIGSGWSWGG